MNVLVGRSQGNALHIHADWNHLSLVRTSVHHLVLHQSFSLSFSGRPSSKCLLPHQGDFHAFDFDFDQVEVHSAHNGVLEVIEGLVILEVNVETVFDAHFHLHGHYLSSCLDLLIRQENCEVDFLDHVEFSRHYYPNEVSDSACDSVKGLVLLFEVGELELVGHVLGEDACWF